MLPPRFEDSRSVPETVMSANEYWVTWETIVRFRAIAVTLGRWTGS